MQNTRVISLSKVNINYLIKFLVLLVVATGAPLMGFHSQWVTGPIVNMVLIMSVFVVGVRGAFLIGLLPSTIALGTGLLPGVLAPMVPFIIIGNTILVLVVDWTVKQKAINHKQRTKNYWVGLIVGAGLKFLFLFLTSGIVAGLLLKQQLTAQVAQMMAWPQFVTAVLGGVLAWGILKMTWGRKEKLETRN